MMTTVTVTAIGCLIVCLIECSYRWLTTMMKMWDPRHCHDGDPPPSDQMKSKWGQVTVMSGLDKVGINSKVRLELMIRSGPGLWWDTVLWGLVRYLGSDRSFEGWVQQMAVSIEIFHHVHRGLVRTIVTQLGGREGVREVYRVVHERGNIHIYINWEGREVGERELLPGRRTVFLRYQTPPPSPRWVREYHEWFWQKRKDFQAKHPGMVW